MSNAQEAPDLRDEVLVCFCHGIPESEIREAIANGAKCLQDIKDMTKASTGCGGCTSECERILASSLPIKP